MRIRDWSSDVGSSDLLKIHLDHVYRSNGQLARLQPGRGGAEKCAFRSGAGYFRSEPGASIRRPGVACCRPFRKRRNHDQFRTTGYLPGQSNRPTRRRSEEHTSELQSLMRISYAVFCLKKKKTTIQL